MYTEQNKLPRKKFLGLGISAAILAAFRLLIPFKNKKSNTVKMLTPDGQLVEVDANRVLPGRGKKITDDQLKTWVAQSR